MKIKLKKQTEAPPNVKDVVKRISSTPFEDIGRALVGFRWAFDKGDINHWVPVLDHFDSFLEQHVSNRADVRLTGTVQEPSFPTEAVLAVLNTTCSILENCSNKGVYNSAEHLSTLLAAPVLEVSIAALRVFQVLMRKTHHTSVRVAVPSGLTKQLLSLCKGWGGKEEGLDMAVCASSSEAALNRVLHKAATLRFEYTPIKQAQANEAAGFTAGAQQVKLHIPNMEKLTEPEHTILAELMQRFSVPAAVRFDLLCRIRIARNFGTLAARRQLIRQRLLAFIVFLQCSPSAEEYSTLYLAEPEVVNELVGLVQAEETVEDEELRTLALRALGAQLHDRSRSSSVITAVTTGGQSGLLAMLLHKSVASILHQAQVPPIASGIGLPWPHAAAAAPQPEVTVGASSTAIQPVAAAAATRSRNSGSMQYSVSFVDALLTVVAAMVTSSTGCQALNDAGVISALLPLLRDLHPDHLGIICTSLKILEMYMDLSQTASTTFRELGGLTEVIKRLATEVKSVAESAARQAEAAAGGQVAEDVVMTAAEQSADRTSAGMASEAAQTSTKQLPHSRKTLLKILLRIITISSYQPTGNLTATRPVDDDAQMLYAALSAIYGHPEEFGGTLFSHAVSVMTDLIHHEPQSFRQLQEAGLPDAFLAAVKAAVFPTGDAMVSIPGALVALCLNSVGLKRVRESCALNVLVDVFTSKKALRVLTGDTPSVLGSGLEELMRFVPSLRSDGVNVVLGVFRALCILGGDEEENAAASKPIPSDLPTAEAAAAPNSNSSHQPEVGTAAQSAPSPSASAQPMETDAAGSSGGHALDVQPAEQEVVGSASDTVADQPTTADVPADGSGDGMDVDQQAGAVATPATAAVAPEQPSTVPGAVAVSAAAPDAAQQERDAERQRQQQEDARLSAIAGRALAESLQQVAGKKDQDADIEAFLPLALTAASRMLEPLLANGETSRLFVERGGAELLLKLYKLPRLTTVFNFSSASHSLLSVFRALSGAHGTAIAAKSKETVAQQLSVLLPMAEEIGAVCVPELPAEKRDPYTKQVLVVQGLVALTSAVARNVITMLPQVSMGDPPVLATMGKLERIVMAQTAASDAWKQARDAAKKVATTAGAGSAPASAPAEAPAEPVGVDAADAGEPGAGIEEEAAGVEEDLVGAAAEQARGGSEATATTRPTNDVNASNRQKRTPEDISYDALSYLLTSLRTFYMGTAKAIHTPVRRRDDPVATPTAPMKAAALNLALLLVGNLQLRPWPQAQQQQRQLSHAPDPMVQPAAASAGSSGEDSSLRQQALYVAVTAVRQCSGHFLRVTEELSQVLFDSRRHYCHLLVLNYFSALGGMQALASALNEASELLWALLAQQGTAKIESSPEVAAAGDQPMADAGGSIEQAEQAPPPGAQAIPAEPLQPATAAASGAAGTKDPKQVMEAVMVKLLAIYEQLANATILLSAPQATNMLLAALPNYAGQPLVPPPKDPLNFVQQLHSHILSAVLPLWNHPKAADAPSGVLTSIVRVLMTCFQGPGPASIILRYSQQGRPAVARVQAQPDPQMVQQIMEMGFTQARAEEALRRVGANSVELAMEWLISQPDDAAATPGAATAGANAEGAGVSSAAPTVSEEEELTRALLASLSVVGMSPDAVAQQSQQQLLAEQAASGGDAAEAAPADNEEIATTPQTTPRPVVQPGAPVLGAAAAAAAIVGSAVDLPSTVPDTPAPTQLLEGALRLIAASPSTGFLIADLLLTIAQRDEGKDRGALLDQLLADCLPAAAEKVEVLDEAQVSRADIVPPTRLLLLLLHKDIASRKVAAGKGLVDRCLQALEAWQSQYSSHVQAFESSSNQQDKQLLKQLQVPVWVEAFLLLLDMMATTPVQRDSTAGRATRATRTVTASAAGHAPVEASAAQAEATVTAAPPAATQANEEDMQTADQHSISAPASSDVAASGSQPPPTQTATVSCNIRLPPELSQLSGLSEVLRNWTPCGALNDNQQRRACAVALTLLQQLHRFADKWDQPSASMFELDASLPNPGSVTTAVLQLLSHLTRCHSNAQQVLAAGGHQLLLSLPSACLAPAISRQESHIGSILRHLLEDHLTLESWMESEIKNSMSIKGARDPYMAGRAYHSNRNPLSRYATAGSFLTMMSSLVSREPAVFMQAVARTCALETVQGETMVRLKTAREQQHTQLPLLGNRDASGAAAPVATEGIGSLASSASGQAKASDTDAAAIAGTATAAAVVPGIHDAAGASERHGVKAAAKSSKKLVPGSFVEVVDALLDVVLSYSGQVVPAQQHPQPGNVPEGEVETAAAAMELDGVPTPVPVQPPASGSQVPASNRHDVAPVPADLLLRKLNPVNREVGIQAMVLRLLADYCLLYNNTVGLLLKRDSEVDARLALSQHHQHAGIQQSSPVESTKPGSRVKSGRHSTAGCSSSGGTGRLSTPGSVASTLQDHKAGAVLKHILHVQLVDHIPEGAQPSNSVAANASALLQAVCIRSGEGRKRVLSEVVAILSGATDSSSSSSSSSSSKSTAAAVTAGRDVGKLPYIYRPGGPHPVQVAACIDLMGALAQNSNSLGLSRNDPRQQNSSTSMPLELLRAMREVGAIKALTHVITVIDTDHAKAKDAINAILKPLEVLTRPLPKSAPAVDGSQDVAARGVQTRRQEQQTAPSGAAGDVRQPQPASGTAASTHHTPGGATAAGQAQTSAPSAVAIAPAVGGLSDAGARQGHTRDTAAAGTGRTTATEHHQQRDGEEAAGPDALAAAGRFVAGGAGQAPRQIPGALINQLMDQLVDIEVELDAAGNNDSEDDSDGGSSDDVDDSDDVGSSEDDEDMADGEEGDEQGHAPGSASDGDDHVVDAPSLTEEEGGTDDVGEHGDAVADFVIGEGAAFINAEGAAAASPGIGPAGHGMAEIDSSEDDHEDSDADDEHGHHQEEYEDAILADDDMHILPPQLDGHHHPHEDGVVDPLDGEDEEEEDEYLDDEDDDQSEDENGLVDAAMADFLDGGGQFGWDVAPPGDLDDLPGLMMPGGFGRMTARRMAYRPTATATAAGVWDESEQGDAAQDALGGVSTAQMLLSQLGLSASGDGSVSRFGPNSRQYRISLLAPEAAASATTGTAGSEAVAGAMSSALYTLSTQLLPQQHRLLALPPRLPVSENAALLQSAAAVVPGAAGPNSDASSLLHGQASSVNALTRLLTRAPDNSTSTSFLRENGRARLVAQRQGGNLFSITLDSVGLPAALGPAANFLQSFELLQPGGMLGGPPGAGALADLDNSVWDEAVNQLLEALAPQGLGRSRAAPSAGAARAAGGQADEASIDPRSLESQLLTMLRAQALNEPSQQEQQQQPPQQNGPQQQQQPETASAAADADEPTTNAPLAQHAAAAAAAAATVGGDGSAPTGPEAAAAPANRTALTEETIAAALQMAMQAEPVPAAGQDVAGTAEQQQQAAASPPMLASHPVDIPSTAPESPAETAAARGADAADAASSQPTPMETEETVQQAAAALPAQLGTTEQAGETDTQQPSPAVAVGASDMEVEGDAAVHEALRQAAEAAEIDLAFLEALPEELRVEVLSARGVELRLPQPTSTLPQQEVPAAPQPISDSTAAAAAAPAPAADMSPAEEGHDRNAGPAPPAPEATAGAADAEGTTVAPAADAAATADAARADAEGPAAAAEEDAIDPEFLAALPEDIRQEVLAQQAAERRARAAAARAAAQRQQEMGLADLLAAMDDDARADALGQLNDSDMAQLPPAMRAQARALRERAIRHQQALQQQQQAAAAVQQQQHDLLLRRAQLGASALNGLVPGAGGRLLMTLGPDGLPVSSRNRFGPLSAALGGSGMRSLGRAELLDAGAQAADDNEGSPLLEESELAVLVQLLKASLPLSKAHLQKLFLNVAGHSSSRKQLLKMLLVLLRSLRGSTSDSAEDESSKEVATDGNTSEDITMQQSPQSLSTTLDMLGQSVVIPVPGAASVAEPSNTMYSATPGKPAIVGRRVLDMLVYLSRHSQRVACQMLTLPVDVAAADPGSEKSRGKLPVTAAAAATTRGLEVLLGMLSAPLCQRSVSLLEQLTVLLEVILSVVQRYEADQQVLAAIKQARKKQDDEAAGSEQQQQEQVQPNAAAAATGDSSQADLQQPPAASSAEPAATPAKPTPFRQAVQAPAVSDAPQQQPQQQPESQLVSTLVSIQPNLLQQLPGLLAQETLSESAYINVAKVVKLVVELAPIHLPMMLDVLVDGVAGVAQALLTLLDTATDKGIDADAQLAPAIGVKSGVVLRMLYALQGFQTEVKRSKQLEEEQQQQSADGQQQQQSAEQPSGVGPVAGSTANQRSQQNPAGGSGAAQGVPSAAGPGSSTAASALNSLDPVAAISEIDKAITAVASRTTPLWSSLSKCILRVEDTLRAVLPQYTQSAGESAGHAAARLLPPGAQQVLPLVEAFFVLCALQGTIPAAPTTGKDLLTAASAEPAMLASSAPEAAAAGSSGSSRRSPAPGPATLLSNQLKRGASAALEGTGTSEGYMPFLQFAERHRRLLNAYIRRNSSLLESSLAPLLRVPKLIDFDNKRAYFKSKVRAQEDRAYAGGLRLAVKRSTVFEDSFNKLRSRAPAEMRGKLSVSFVGEEGIDAGGVSREWYQVMAREIFNPNLALFVSVPEGGTTFQPNPNSVVQSDTGVSHLEYFKFVGRLVGKALYDGQLMDAYFTRSFYKHMLGQPLTYEDIEAVDPEYYKNLKWMLENDITDVLDLTFTAESDFFGKTEIVELVPGGREVKVVEANKHEYVNLIARHRMTTSIKPQIQAFLEGFWQLIPRDLISIFNDHELELLISGLPDIDVADLRANTEYTGYTAASPVIQWFWQVVAEMDKQDLALLLQFVTGTSKVPLGGFKTLQGISGPQRFQIHKSYGADRLPSAHTCFNQLDLPEYDSKEQLAERLAMAIHEGHEGFGFG